MPVFTADNNDFSNISILESKKIDYHEKLDKLFGLICELGSLQKHFLCQIIRALIDIFTSLFVLVSLLSPLRNSAWREMKTSLIKERRETHLQSTLGDLEHYYIVEIRKQSFHIGLLALGFIFIYLFKN